MLRLDDMIQLGDQRSFTVVFDREINLKGLVGRDQEVIVDKSYFQRCRIRHAGFENNARARRPIEKNFPAVCFAHEIDGFLAFKHHHFSRALEIIESFDQSLLIGFGHCIKLLLIPIEKPRGDLVSRRDPVAHFKTASLDAGILIDDPYLHFCRKPPSELEGKTIESALRVYISLLISNGSIKGRNITVSGPAIARVKRLQIRSDDNNRLARCRV